MSSQLVLGVQLRDEATFANFFVGSNQQAVASLANFLNDDQTNMIYLWGRADEGKTHLLQALCHLASEQQQTAFYLPLSSDEGFSPEILQDIEHLPLLAIDDVDAICGDAQWEEALFHVYNRVRDIGSKLIVTANQSPTQLAVSLPDLRSRLAWGVTYHLAPLTEDEKLSALMLHAQTRGMHLSDEIGYFLLRRCSRDMRELMDILERLDHASLQEKRRLTIPFVKSVLAL